jgi:hypothetical protein
MIESGIAARMITVRRQLPRNSRIIRAVRPAAMQPPMMTLLSEALTNTDWSKIALIETPLGQHVLDVRQRRANAVDHREGRDAAGLADGHQGARRAVDRHRIRLHLKAVVDVRHVAHEHGAAVDLP